MDWPERTRLAAWPGLPLVRDDEGGTTRPNLLRPGWKIIAVAVVALALGLGLKDLVWMLARPLSLIFVGYVLALAFLPIVEWLRRWMPRGLAIALVYLVIALVLGGLLWLVVPPLITQSRSVAEQLPQLLDRFQQWLQQIGIQRDMVGNFDVVSLAQQFGQRLVSLPLLIVSTVLDLFFVIALSVWWLISIPRLHRFVLSLAPEPGRSQIASILHEMGTSMGGFVRGTVIDMTIIGVLLYVAYLIIGVEYGLALAVLGGLLEAIPIVGPIVAAVPAIAIGLLHSLPQALMILALYIAVQQFESHVLTPKVMRSQTDVPPLLVLVAVVLGGAAGGLLGVIIAIPLAAAARVFVLRAVVPWVQVWTGAAAPS